MDFIDNHGTHDSFMNKGIWKISSPISAKQVSNNYNTVLLSLSTNNEDKDEVDNRDGSNINYRFESIRHESYRNWPLAYMDPEKLASAGFYYTGNADRVKCFECGVEIFQWVEGDDPMSDHKLWRANCRFIRKKPCGNVPTGVDPTTISLPLPKDRDVCGPYGEQDLNTQQTEFTNTSLSTLPSLGLARPKEPCHPKYANYDARLKTFDTWPKSLTQTKEQLADAGFYYIGTGDQTQCYHCGGGLKDWEPSDNPWTQHVKWFTKCYYVLTVKGQAYVNSVIGRGVAASTKEETMQMNLSSQKVEQSTSQDLEMSTEDELAGENQLQRPSDINQPKQKKSADDPRICKICYNEELGVVFLPCTHMIACVKCAPSMLTCAVCRERITMTVRAIIS